MAKKLLFVSIYPKGAACDYLLAPFVLKNFAKKNKFIAENISFEILNFKSGDAEKYIEEINSKKADYICFSTYIWNLEDVLFIGENLSDENIACIFGGAEISQEKIGLFENIKNKKIFLIGEGETIFTNALIGLLNHKFVDTNSVLVSEKTTSDNLNIPVIYDEDFPKNHIRFREISLETQRGCAFNCNYCWYNKGNSNIRYLDLKDVFSQLDVILANQPREVRFTDPVFFSDKERGKKILRYILDKKLDELPLIFIENDIFHLTEDVLDLFVEFKSRQKINNYAEIPACDRPQYFSEGIDGYNLISTIGIQSFNKKALASVGRHYVSPDKYRDFMKIIREKNVLLKVDMIFGFPFETLETFENALNIAINELYQTDCFFEIHNLLVIPNTKLFENAEKLGLTFDNTNSVVETSQIPKEDFYKGKLLSAVTYRVMNSPLRNLFIEKCREKEISYTDLIKRILEKIDLPDGLKDFGFTDFYWQKQIFFDIKSDELLKLIKEC